MTSNDWWISNEISLKKIQNCKISWKKYFWKRKHEKIDCTDSINTFSRHVVRDSGRFTQRQARQLVHKPIKIIIFSFYWVTTTPGWTRSARKPWFWCPQSSKKHEMSDVRAFPAPPPPKTMRETKYYDPKSSHEKKHFFYRKCFFAIFSTFFDTSTSRFSRFCRSGDVSVPNNVIHRLETCSWSMSSVRRSTL